MKSYITEKTWVTKSGLQAAVVKHNNPPLFSHRCGYVKIPKDHGLYKVDYHEIEHHVSVHGGLTFSGSLDFIQPDSYWFGYDCAHSFDKSCANPKGPERTLEYCIEECELLSSQICNSPLSLFYMAKKVGKLPIDLHNQMLAFGIEDSSNVFVKKYIELLNNL